MNLWQKRKVKNEDDDEADKTKKETMMKEMRRPVIKRRERERIFPLFFFRQNFSLIPTEFGSVKGIDFSLIFS